MPKLDFGSKALVSVPKELSDPFLYFSSLWQAWAKTLDGQIVELSYANNMGFSSTPNYPNGGRAIGFDIVSNYTDCANWLPEEWLAEVTPIPKGYLSCCGGLGAHKKFGCPVVKSQAAAP